MKIYLISFIGFCFLVSMCSQTRMKNFIGDATIIEIPGSASIYDIVYSTGDKTIKMRNDSLFFEGDSLSTIKSFFHECLRLQSELTNCRLSKDSLKDGFYKAAYYSKDLYW